MSGLDLAIQSASALVAEKRQQLQMLGMMNVHGLSQPQAVQATMKYAQAQADLLNAERALCSLLAQKASR
jgi:hypothetical protein